MTTPTLELQKAVLAALNSGVTRADVYETAPDRPSIPYVVLGEEFSRAEDYKPAFGEIINFQLHVWTRSGPGTSRTLQKQIQGEVDAAIRGSALSLDTMRLISMNKAYVQTLRDPDDASLWHGVMRYEAQVIEP